MKSKFGYAVAIVIIVGFFITLITLLRHPERFENIIVAVIGGLLTCVVTIVNYFWGTSKSSADKTELLNGVKK